MIELTDLQRDAIGELFNIGMGRAAGAMGRLVQEEVVLSVPEIGLLGRSEAANLLAAVTSPRVCGVRQYVRGAFNAETLLIFPQAKSLEIVRAMIGEDVPLEAMTDLEQEALSEIGNIILNACIGTLGNILHQDFDISLPEFSVGACAELMGVSETSATDHVLLLYIDFRLEKHQISGHVVFIQDLVSVQAFIDSVQKYIDQITAGTRYP